MTAHQLRSRNWFGRSDLDGFVHRSWPVIGIANSWSRVDELQRTSPPGRRGRQAWRVERGRLSSGVSNDLAGRSPHEADDHALSQSHGDGRRRVHSSVSP